ncbi:MAG TPA: hypothetical protein VMM93_09255, partial [Vicinamibacterales bacterium]|nr:hypothetical protein [Vicinamibacterales bacterium]
MSTDSDAVSTARMVRASLDIAGLRWVKPFQVAYELDFDRVSSFFAGHPQQPGVWADTIARVGRLSRDHVAMAACLDAQLAARAAPAEARAGAARL